MVDDIRELRILFDLGGDLRKVCKLAFSKTDASLYLFPYAPSRHYYYGHRSVDGIEFEDTFSYADDTFTEGMPKLSIHESGQVHIKSDQPIAGPLQIPPLAEWRGQHIASVSVDSFEGLAKFEGRVSSSGPKQDKVIKVVGDVKSGRIPLYLAGDRASFTQPDCGAVITMRRPHLKRPVYVCIKPKPQELSGDTDQQGIVVLAGWQPNPQEGEGTDYLYIRGV